MSGSDKEQKTTNVLCIIDTNIIGGPGKSILQLKKEFIDSDINLIICVFSGRTRTPGEFQDELMSRGFDFYKLHERFRYDPIIIRQALKLVKEFDVDIIQSHGYKADLLCYILKKTVRLPWIAFAHGWTNEGLKMRLYNFLDKLLLPRADKIVAVSSQMKKQLVRLGANPFRVYVIHNAVEEAPTPAPGGGDPRKMYGIEAGAPLIGVIGRLSPEKGQAFFLKAFKRTVDVIPQAKALIIGDGPDRAVLEKMAIKSGLVKNIFFTGYQKNATALYPHLDIIVIPSLNEGFPNVALEAMLYGRPVIATSVGGLPELIDNNENGFIVPPADPLSLSNAMIDLIKNPLLGQKISLAGREKVLLKFNPADRAAKIKDIYNNTKRQTK